MYMGYILVAQRWTVYVCRSSVAVEVVVIDVYGPFTRPITLADLATFTVKAVGRKKQLMYLRATDTRHIPFTLTS